MSTHGNHWSFPNARVQFVSVADVQSRFAGVADASLLTRVGPIHVEPPSVERKKNTSVLELRFVPFRLSEKTM